MTSEYEGITANGQSVVTVDAFASSPFSGNSAAVCVLDTPRSELWMQNVAREMNLAETSFVVRRSTGSVSDTPEFDLRWFTPTVEVDLCGHATLATAHVLWTEGHIPSSAPRMIKFHTKSGVLLALTDSSATSHTQGPPLTRGITLDFPAEVPSAAEVPGVLDALGVPTGSGGALFIGRNRMDVLVQLRSETAVRALQPDTAALARIPSRGVIVTAKAASPESGFDYVSRFFAPAAGIAEDPVTGSAHCGLAPFWSDASRLGRSHLTGYQASSRGGTVRTILRDGGRVHLVGDAVTTMRGTLLA
eukprot:TRINITY_DN68568_c0_g1_i1.p1 TRINITY_DN68568_c0_g1~~TRINITY_DN68568_c0_g1_i1.p1  ORF type:complete len:304 (+),score=33.33 TRINITY_DN68568_c0_g1_i1:66-977(+)